MTDGTDASCWIIEASVIISSMDMPIFLSFSIHIVCELRFSVCEKASERLFRALADIEIICVGIDIALEQERAILRMFIVF